MPGERLMVSFCLSTEKSWAIVYWNQWESWKVTGILVIHTVWNIRVCFREILMDGLILWGGNTCGLGVRESWACLKHSIEVIFRNWAVSWALRLVHDLNDIYILTDNLVNENNRIRREGKRKAYLYEALYRGFLPLLMLQLPIVMQDRYDKVCKISNNYHHSRRCGLYLCIYYGNSYQCTYWQILERNWVITDQHGPSPG